MTYEDCKLVVVAQNAGGEGKSTWAEALVALGTIAGLQPLVFDADPGMRGFRNRSGGQGLIELSWGENHAAGEDGTNWCEKHFNDRKLVLIDTGANFFSAAHRVQNYLSEVIGAALELRVTVAIHVVVGTNKVGSFRGAVDFHHQYGQHVDVVLVRNSRAQATCGARASPLARRRAGTLGRCPSFQAAPAKSDPTDRTAEAYPGPSSVRPRPARQPPASKARSPGSDAKSRAHGAS
ncbi:hypothetical protein QPK87_24425 [Kamptonema cortianum]|nr:hypothetical protein [Kamptonema cortianum]